MRQRKIITLLKESYAEFVAGLREKGVSEKGLEEAIARRYDAERKALMEESILAAAICKDFVWMLDRVY